MAQKATRTGKESVRPEAELREMWRSDLRAQGVDLGEVIGRARDLPVDTMLPSADAALLSVTQTLSSYTRADVAEHVAALMPTGIDPATVLAEVERITDEAIGQSVNLDAPGLQAVADPSRREGSTRYSSHEVLREEARASQVAAEYAGLEVDGSGIVAEPGRLSESQAEAMRTLVESDRRASVLIAPAGAGKTASLVEARGAWEAAGRQVIGLAPTGRAADQMTADGATTSAHTLATVTGQLDRGESLGWGADTVVIVDEAGMAGTADLVRLLDTAQAEGARLVMVGDPAQIAPVRARGGLLEHLGRTSPDTARLDEVWRQADPVEARAGLALRDGTGARLDDAVDWYAEAGRLHTGSEAAMAEQAYQAWSEARAGDADALLMAPTHEMADALNRRAQADLHRQWADMAREAGLDVGEVPTVGLSRGMHAAPGDEIMTTRNEYSLTATGGDPVRNGHRWRVSRITDGQVIADRLDGGGRVTLPPEYLADSATLGYAGTVHAAQGATCDVAISLMDADRTDRSSAYVAMTRGKTDNTAYIYERLAGEQAHQHRAVDGSGPVMRTGTQAEARGAFAGIMERSTADRSAHSTILDNLAQARGTGAGLPGPAGPGIGAQLTQGASSQVTQSAAQNVAGQAVQGVAGQAASQAAGQAVAGVAAGSAAGGLVGGVIGVAGQIAGQMAQRGMQQALTDTDTDQEQAPAPSAEAEPAQDRQLTAEEYRQADAQQRLQAQRDYMARMQARREAAAERYRSAGVSIPETERDSGGPDLSL